VNITKKPSRKQLLKVIVELQDLIGKAQARHGNDRDPNGFEKGQKLLEEAFQLCLEARQFDPPE
jgi:hypothetical protein